MKLTLLGVLLMLLCRADWAGAYVEDFSAADPAAWKRTDPPKAEIVTEAGKTFLRVTGREQLALKIPTQDRQDFVLQARVRGPGGVHFRDGYKVFFKTTGDMWIRRPGSMLLDWVRTPRSVQEFHAIRVVAVGKIVRVYVDDALEFEGLDHAPKAAPFFLCGSGDFDLIRVDEAIPPDEAVMATPRDAGANFFDEYQYRQMKMTGPRVQDVALAFKTAEPVRIPIVLLNYGENSELGVQANLDDFDGHAFAERTLAGEGTLDFGPVTHGFHRLQLGVLRGKQLVRTVPYPVFVGVPDPPVAYREPVIPFGVLLQTSVWKPFHTKTYWHGIAALLRAHHMNTVVFINCHREFPEIFEQYGIATLERSEVRQDYRSVLGLLALPEDLEKVRALQESNKKPVMAALSVDDLGSGTDKDPLKAWKTLKPGIRVLRLPRVEATLSAALQRVSTGFDSPWWALIPVGNSAAELRALTHLALAYGAKGVLYASLQGGAEGGGLVNYLSLRPVDDKLAIIAELGQFVSGSGEQLVTLKPGTHVVKCDPKSVLAVPVLVNDKPGAYLVNTNTQETVTVTVDGRKASVILGPGGGKLVVIE